jgi:hypothetical protein
MVYAGLRYSIPQNDGRTKLGFEFNHGTKYWFNFAQAEDDIVAPKSNTRGEAYEIYTTHRINDHFIFKADFTRYNYAWSGSGWHLGAPKRLMVLALRFFGWRSRVLQPFSYHFRTPVFRRLDSIHIVSAITRNGLPEPFTIFSGAAMTTAPTGGSWSRLQSPASPNLPLPCMM